MQRVDIYELSLFCHRLNCCICDSTNKLDLYGEKWILYDFIVVLYIDFIASRKVHELIHRNIAFLLVCAKDLSVFYLLFLFKNNGQRKSSCVDRTKMYTMRQAYIKYETIE